MVEVVVVVVIPDGGVQQFFVSSLFFFYWNNNEKKGDAWKIKKATHLILKCGIFIKKCLICGKMFWTNMWQLLIKKWWFITTCSSREYTTTTTSTTDLPSDMLVIFSSSVFLFYFSLVFSVWNKMWRKIMYFYICLYVAGDVWLGFSVGFKYKSWIGCIRDLIRNCICGS